MLKLALRIMIGLSEYGSSTIFLVILKVMCRESEICCVRADHIKTAVLFRLKKEMMSRVSQVAAEFRKASDRQLADTTKRTIRENVSISAQLAKISDKTVELIANNDSLKERERRQRQEIELLQASETLMTEKNIANQKVITLLPVGTRSIAFRVI